MNIYEPCAFSKEPGELKQLTSHLAEYVLPGAVPLSPPLDSDPIHLALRQKEILIQFVLFARELGEEGFKILLDHVARLEAKRNEQHDPTLQEIGICFAAPGFSRNFLSRIPFELVRVSLIEWSFIRSEGREGILIRNVRKGISLEPASHKMIRSEDAARPSAMTARSEKISKSSRAVVAVYDDCPTGGAGASATTARSEKISKSSRAVVGASATTASPPSTTTAQRVGLPSATTASLPSQSAFHYAPQELSTPEWVTFSRFGMELRSRKSLR